MPFIYRYIFQIIWLAWAGYWWQASGNGKTDVYKESTASRLLHLIPLGIAFLLLAWRKGPFLWMGLGVLPLKYW